MNSKELVERWREHGPATGATLLEIAVSAGMPDDKRVKWCRALQYASTVADRAFDHLAAQDARMEVLVGELFQAHVTWTQQVQALREDAATLRADLAKAKEALEAAVVSLSLSEERGYGGSAKRIAQAAIKELPHD